MPAILEAASLHTVQSRCHRNMRDFKAQQLDHQALYRIDERHMKLEDRGGRNRRKKTAARRLAKPGAARRTIARGVAEHSAGRAWRPPRRLGIWRPVPVRSAVAAEVAAARHLAAWKRHGAGAAGSAAAGCAAGAPSPQGAAQWPGRGRASGPGGIGVWAHGGDVLGCLARIAGGWPPSGRPPRPARLRPHLPPAESGGASLRPALRRVTRNTPQPGPPRRPSPGWSLPLPVDGGGGWWSGTGAPAPRPSTGRTDPKSELPHLQRTGVLLVGCQCMTGLGGALCIKRQT
jgi:hypothetical protein